MQSQVLDQLDNSSLRLYVSWVPILPGDSEEAARESSKLIGDSRASHFWDADKALPPLFALLLGLPEDWPAWDVYMAYPAGATWDDVSPAPPPPAFWHHQLGDDLDVAPKLDGVAFEKQLRELMEGS